MNWSETNILVTGGTGSFGRKLVDEMLAHHQPKRLVIFSRDELKQFEMRNSGYDHPSLRYFIGDVRDVDRLRRAMNGIDVVIHAAALKQVPACEYNPIEAVMTNSMGGRNVIEAALDAGVKKVMAISTDKAVCPANLYGATKLVAEKLFVQANVYSGSGPTRFACVRYGNVVNSRGSVIPLFLEQRKKGVITVTDPRMTRFWLTLKQAVRFVIRSIEDMHGGEVFVPKIPSMRVTDLVAAIAPECAVEQIGIRPGEKLHEVLMSEDEGRNAVELEALYVIKPPYPAWSDHTPIRGRPVPDGFRYASDTNARWLSVDEIKSLVAEKSDVRPAS